MTTYATPPGGLPPQSHVMTDRAIFTDAFAVIPAGSMRDTVTSLLPGWSGTRAWVLARPMTGFAETFSQMIVEVSPSGGSAQPEPDQEAQGVLFVVSGALNLVVEGESHLLRPGGYAYLAPGAAWSIENSSEHNATFHWIRKRHEPVPGLDRPNTFITHENDVSPVSMPDTEGRWSTTRFVDPNDLRHDMHVNIVTFQPGACIPFAETHVMEHGLYVLEGKAVYRLNGDWIEVAAGDFMWLRAFCPQACYAGGPGSFRYLLYKDVNRHMPLSICPGQRP